eukprot:TRINITY_DN36925_c0_g1_i1.p1 TRINITY_DN36925_c0_g1~~TRINITY_DN36925_c0_g1_i1.p1  ORF type:complete len:507 (-),score=144.77 TRINITY_DN36925_c0_g1_i1:107-1627(-)
MKQLPDKPGSQGAPGTAESTNEVEKSPAKEKKASAAANAANQTGPRSLAGGYRQGEVALAIDTKPKAMQEMKQGTGEELDQDSEGEDEEERNAPALAPTDAILTHKLPFNAFVAFVTVLNTVVLGLEQDASGDGEDGKQMWHLVSMLFIAIFCLELLVRIRVHRRGFFADFGNIVDLAITSASAVDIFTLVTTGSGGMIRLFTVLRTLRIIQLVRLVRMFPFFRELWLLVGGFIGSLKALGWVACIVLIVLYVCSVLVTTEIGQNDALYSSGPSYDGEVWPYKEYFGTVWRSMFTLFQVITLDGWCDDIVRHVIHRQPAMVIFFALFLLLTTFGLMNVVVGIIVENTLAASEVADSRAEAENAHKRRIAVEKLSEVLAMSDVNRNGEITLEELLAAGESPIVQAQFQTIGLKFDEAKEIFNLLDYERRGCIELKRFAASCRELVGGARRRDIVQVEITVGTLAQRLDGLDHKFTTVEKEVAALHRMANDFTYNTVRLLTGFDSTTS